MLKRYRIRLVSTWQNCCLENVARVRASNTLFDIYISIFLATFDAMFRTIRQPKSFFQSYITWRQIPYRHIPDSLHHQIAREHQGKLFFSIIAAACAIVIILLFAAMFVLMLPYCLILWLVARFFRL